MHGRREPANVSVFDEAPLRPFPSVGATWPHLCEFLWNFIRNHGVTDNISSNLELRMHFNKHLLPDDSLQSVLLLLRFCLAL